LSFGISISDVSEAPNKEAAHLPRGSRPQRVHPAPSFIESRTHSSCPNIPTQTSDVFRHLDLPRTTLKLDHQPEFGLVSSGLEPTKAFDQLPFGIRHISLRHASLSDRIQISKIGRFVLHYVVLRLEHDNEVWHKIALKIKYLYQHQSYLYYAKRQVKPTSEVMEGVKLAC
jgi:hypothetical protein